MSDIVKRLRIMDAEADSSLLRLDAIAEIERLRAELTKPIFSESDLECEGPAHICHNLATERAEVRRLLKWQQEMIDAVNSGKVYRIRALIEEAGHECRRCQGTGAIDAPTSDDDPSCPECDGSRGVCQ